MEGPRGQGWEPVDLSEASSLLVSFLSVGSPGPLAPGCLRSLPPLHCPPPQLSPSPHFPLLLFSDSSWGGPSSWLLRMRAEEETGWGGCVVGRGRFSPGLSQAFRGSQGVADSPAPCELLPCCGLQCQAFPQQPRFSGDSGGLGVFSFSTSQPSAPHPQSCSHGTLLSAVPHLPASPPDGRHKWAEDAPSSSKPP